MHVKFAKQFTHYLILFQELESNKKKAYASGNHATAHPTGQCFCRTCMVFKTRGSFEGVSWSNLFGTLVSGK